MKITTFQPQFGAEVLRLIVSIQREEFSIDVSAEQQPDLQDIPNFYQRGAGNFWVALSDGRVVGTLALLDIGNQQGALRKMFVHPDFRGKLVGTASSLLKTLLAWARARGISELYLGTISKFHAAQRFYEKHGFIEVSPAALPRQFPRMTVDDKFYRHDVGRDPVPDEFSNSGS